MCAQTPAQLEADLAAASVNQKETQSRHSNDKKKAGVRECISSSLGNCSPGNAHKIQTVEMWSVFCLMNQIVLAAVVCIRGNIKTKGKQSSVI